MEQQADSPTDTYTSTSEPSGGSHQSPHQTARRQAAKRKKLFIMAGSSLGALLLLAGPMWYFFLRSDDAPAARTSTTTSQQQRQTPTETPASTPTDASPVTYKSTKLNVELTHRKDWTVKESANNAEIIATSPRVAYTTADGQATTGVFTLKIRKGVTDQMKATIEKAIASRNSEVIAYSAPTEQQRFYTNVSYGGAVKDQFNFFIVTGSTEFKAGGPFAYTLVLNEETYMIAGGYGADKNDTLQFDAVPASEIESEAKAQAIAIVESLKIY